LWIFRKIIMIFIKFIKKLCFDIRFNLMNFFSDFNILHFNSFWFLSSCWIMHWSQILKSIRFWSILIFYYNLFIFIIYIYLFNFVFKFTIIWLYFILHLLIMRNNIGIASFFFDIFFIFIKILWLYQNILILFILLWLITYLFLILIVTFIVVD
jgi:hypothetical protein